MDTIVGTVDKKHPSPESNHLAKILYLYTVPLKDGKVKPIVAERNEAGQYKSFCPFCESRYRDFFVDLPTMTGRCLVPYCHQTCELTREPPQTEGSPEKKVKGSVINDRIKAKPVKAIESEPLIQEDPQPATARGEAASKDEKTLYSRYLENGFVPLLCNGYHPKHNQEKDPEKAYKLAKIPTYEGWNKPNYVAPTLKEIEAWEKAGGWGGWKIPEGSIYPDVEDPEDTAEVRSICHLKGINPGVHCTNKGFHFGFITDLKLPAASTIWTKLGIKITYRVGGKNYLILAPTNGRTWEVWKDVQSLPVLPDQLTPYDRKSVGDVLNCLSHSVRAAYREKHFAGYEDLDAAYMAFLIACNLSEEMIHHSFRIIFRNEYKENQTRTMWERTRTRIKNGEPLIGAGTFLQKAKDSDLKEVLRFARELQSLIGADRATVNDEWPDPIPFDEYSSLPDFPLDALSGIGREVVEAVSEVNQVDPALPVCLYLAALSSCCSKKAKIDLISHKEPLNLYLSPIYDSGNRKSSTTGDMTKPLYEFQKARQENMRTTIQEAQNAFRIKEKRIERLQKKAAEEDDPVQRQQLEEETAKLTRDLAETPIPNSPIYLVDDVTPEKLGSLMADNGERMAVITPEGGLFEIMAGRYSKDGVGNIDLFLKAHAGDFWSNHRIGREANTMQAPALTLCLAVQSEVIEEAGKNKHLQGKGLLARFLYSRCKSKVGYRERQTKNISPLLMQRYKNHILSLMDMPFTENDLRLSPDAQALWNEFYNDVEQEMRPGSSLYYLSGWGSKLPGAVARIAGLLHLAKLGVKGLSLPISVDIVSASCVIGAYFKEHAIAVFGLMQEDRRFKLARQILDYLKRQRPDRFKGRDVMHHSNIPIMEDVEQGLKVLLDRGYIREGGNDGSNRVNHTGPGRPSAKTYRVNPKAFERRMG